jgi:hypothetical protein
MSEPELRIADADRERAAERLRKAAGEGRLSPEELEERLDAAFSARTQSELKPVLADLPGDPARRPRARARRPELRAFAATSILLVAIWALTGAGYFWPVWPILGWGLFVLGPGHRHMGTSRVPACRRTASSRPSTSR